MIHKAIPVQFGARIPLLKDNPMGKDVLRGPDDERGYFPTDAEKAKTDLAAEGHEIRTYSDTPVEELADPDIPATSGVTVRLKRPGYIAGEATVLLGLPNEAADPPKEIPAFVLQYSNGQHLVAITGEDLAAYRRFVKGFIG